ncbi:hypothetical protein LCGC14_2942330, partial [marine sediment metagenome]
AERLGARVPCEEEAYRWVRHAVLAVCCLHERTPRAVIHCDIKSPNFLVAQDGLLRLCDFGTAVPDTLFNRDTTLQQQRSTAAWTAPEVLHADARYTPASDAYSMALVIWELVHFATHDRTYRMPLADELLALGPRMAAPAALLFQLATRPHLRPPMDERVPIEWRRIIENSWAEDVAQRRTAVQTRDALYLMMAVPEPGIIK